MSESYDRPLQLTVQGLRRSSGQWEATAEPVPLVLPESCEGDAGKLVRLLRRTAGARMDMCLLKLASGREALDLDSPTPATGGDLDEMVEGCEQLLGALRVLREMVPEPGRYDDSTQEAAEQL